MTNGGDAAPVYAAKLPARLLQNCRVLPARADLIESLRDGSVFCEVGVALGDFSATVLETGRLAKFYAIDLFGLHGAPQMWGGRVGRELGERRHIEYFRAKFQRYLDDGTMEILQGDSVQMLKRLPDGGIDVFYVDANHTYQSVKAELSIIKQKTNLSGMIVLNDYIMADWVTNTKYGVVQAVNEFMIAENWEMIFLALHTGMFCDVALRKIDLDR